MPEYRVTRDESEVASNVFDVETVETTNPFGNYAVVKVYDFEGAEYDNYPFGTRIDVDVDTNDNGTFDHAEFTGFVVDRREVEQDGADKLEVEAYTFDQFLRKNDVSNDLSGLSIEAALESIVTNDTPVSWNANKVNIGDPHELTLSLQDERVETALQMLSFKSNNEKFGVDDNLDFYFEPREPEQVDRGINDTEWFSHDLVERGNEAINEVEVRFNGGNEKVVVDSGSDKLDLQESLDLPDPATQKERLARPEIDDIEDAREEGERWLDLKNVALTGDVQSFDLWDASPFDTIDIEIIERGIDDEFQIVSVGRHWGSDTVSIGVVEKRGFDDDVLVRLGEKTERIDLRDTDPDGIENRITATNIGSMLEASADFHGVPSDAERVVNDGRNLVRDGWIDGSTLTISDIAIGTSGADLSRTNTSLENEVTRLSATATLPESDTITLSADFTETGVQEVGVFDSSGALVSRAVLDNAVDVSGGVSLSIRVGDDSELSRGVVTNAGQTAIRDILADNGPKLPSQYAYGRDGTDPKISDVALGNQAVALSLNNVLIQDADSSGEWDEIVPPISAGTPLEITSTGELKTLPICWTTEGENFNDANTTSTSATEEDNADYSGGTSAPLYRGPNASGGPDYAEWNFTVEHEIAASDFAVQVRDDADSDGASAFYWELVHTNGNTYQMEEMNNVGAGLALGWTKLPTYDGNGYNGPDLPPGEYTLRCEITDSNSNVDATGLLVDVVAPYDESRETELTFDDTVDSNGYLSGPELYSELVETSLETAETRRKVSEATFSLMANSVANSFYVELANDGATYTRVNNADSGTVNFSSEETSVDTNIGLSRYGSRTTATPTTGFNGQEIADWLLYADPDAIVSDQIGVARTRAISPPGNLANEELREGGHLASDDTLLSRVVFPPFDISSQTRVESSEKARFDTGEITADLAQAQMLARVGQNYSVLETEAGVTAAQARQILNTIQR